MSVKKNLLLMSLLSMLFLVGCEKYGDVPIVGSWRLSSYTSGEGYITPVPSVDNTFCLCFEGDGSFRGNGYYNTFWGNYSLDKNRITIDVKRMTEVGTEQNERVFIDALKNVSSFNVSGGFLVLDYDDKAMTFKRESVIIPTN